MITVHDLGQAPLATVEAWTSHIAEHIRDQDRDEIAASSGLDPLAALRTSIAVSSKGYAILDREGVPIALFGVTPHPLPGVGVVWMLGTDGVVREGLSIARQTRHYMDVFQQDYHLLWNYVDERNTVSIRWLKRAGYKALSQHTAGGHPFRIFARSA